MDENHIIIDLRNVCFRYPGGDPVLEDLTFQLSAGQRIGLMGHNGSGKTTLFHLIMGLLRPEAGRMELFGRPVQGEKDFREFRQRIGLLFQDADDQLFSPTVLEDVAFGPLNAGKTSAQAQKIARDTLDLLGLEGFEDRVTHKLSGGEKRLVSLATVLAMEPEVLLLDEPISNLDDRTREKFKGILQGLELSYILISHELDFLAQTTHTIYKMEEGKILLDQEIHPHYHYHGHPHGAYPHQHEIEKGKGKG
jgi:cobalt/nickel transport system ATP-binding protein